MSSNNCFFYKILHWVLSSGGRKEKFCRLLLHFTSVKFCLSLQLFSPYSYLYFSVWQEKVICNKMQEVCSLRGFYIYAKLVLLGETSKREKEGALWLWQWGGQMEAITKNQIFGVQWELWAKETGSRIQILICFPKTDLQELSWGAEVPYFKVRPTNWKIKPSVSGCIWFFDEVEVKILERLMTRLGC